MNKLGKSYLKPIKTLNRNEVEIGIDMHAVFLNSAKHMNYELSFLDNINVIAILIDGQKVYYKKMFPEQQKQYQEETINNEAKALHLQIAIGDKKP